MLGAGRWWNGSLAVRGVEPVSLTCFSPPNRGPGCLGGVLCGAPPSQLPPTPTFPARWDCQGPPGKRLRVLPFLLNFLGPSRPARNMEGHEAQHASTAAHTLGYATRSSGA